METHYDVAILGTGMGGTLLATILARQGVHVIMVDAGTHPRFAIGESTIPHTSLLLSLLAQQYNVPEIDYLAYPDLIARHVCSTCGIKRSFGFAYHRPGMPYDHREGLQFGTSSKDENHLFRQDIDAYLLYVALRYGVSVHQNCRVEDVEIGAQGVRLSIAGGEVLRARFVVDATGFRSVLALQFGLREVPPSLRHESRTLFTHMLDVKPFAELDNPLTLSWQESTLHHVFDGGWFWVIPFNNRSSSTNPLTSVGLTLDTRRFPGTSRTPEEEFRQFLKMFPSVLEQFSEAKVVRPWISTGRLQYSSRNSTGYRYCLMSHASGFVDPLFSRGLINTLEVISRLVPSLLESLRLDNFSPNGFASIDEVQRRVLDYNDQLVSGAYAAWADFDLWNAWTRVWALGTILTEYRLMNVLTDYTATGDKLLLQGEATKPAFSEFEDPDYAAFFERAARFMDAYIEGALSAQEATSKIWALSREYAFPVPLREDAMHRAGWLDSGRSISERNLDIARRGYRWALTNPTSRDLFGNTEMFYRWRAQRPDPHLA